MLLYSFALTVSLVLSAPWWLLRMATTQRYREGLGERLGAVPARLRGFVAGKKIVWLHAVSVGEVLAASRLVGELEDALGEDWRLVVSTTTRTGQALARERFGTERVFYMPLDFAFAVRAYLRALKPAAVVLMESELWPRMLWECGRAGVPAAVVNARVSDRSFARAMRFKKFWRSMTEPVSLWLAQSVDDAHRLEALGVEDWKLQTPGNLKFDVRAAKASHVARMIATAAAGRSILVAGSTLDGEERMLIDAWKGSLRSEHRVMLVLAPRHPERFEKIYGLAKEYRAVRAADLSESAGMPEIIVLNTMGDLASVYEYATIAFVGGSMVPRGGHNPLEPAQFGVPIVMGSSWENFRDIVYRLSTAGGIKTLPSDDAETLENILCFLILQPDARRESGEQARRVFDKLQGATARVAVEIDNLIRTKGNA